MNEEITKKNIKLNSRGKKHRKFGRMPLNQLFRGSDKKSDALLLGV